MDDFDDVGQYYADMDSLIRDNPKEVELLQDLELEEFIKGLLGKYVCPICGHQIHFKQGDKEPDEMDGYCSKCGQAIDGSEQV